MTGQARRISGLEFCMFLHRREFLGSSVALGASRVCAEQPRILGAVEGEARGKVAGTRMLADGNAIDAIVAAAFVASVTSPQMCGPGGYGGSFIAAIEGGTKIVAIDFNSTALAAAKSDLFPLDAQGRVKGNVHMYGWLAAKEFLEKLGYTVVPSGHATVSAAWRDESHIRSTTR